MTVEGDSVGARGSSTLHARLDDLERQIGDAQQLLNGALNALSKAETDVQNLRQSRVSETVAQHPLPAVVATEHRRLHRAGRPPKIDTDPELQAFLLARVDRQTFEEMAQDVADHFPPARRVGKSSIHLWWTKRHAQ